MSNNYVVLSRDAPIICRLVRWYRPIVVYTISKYNFFILLPKVNKHESCIPFPVKVGAFCNFAFGCVGECLIGACLSVKIMNTNREVHAEYMQCSADW